MSSYQGVIVSDPWLQSQFTQVELRTLKSKAYLNLQGRAIEKTGGTKSSFLKATTTTVHHAINESEKASYVAHINGYLAEDKFLKDYLPIDPSTNELFDLAKNGVLLCKLINVAVPGTIDERAINTKKVLNPWERNENHTLCLNSAKAIGCTVVNIGAHDLVEGRHHLVLGLISQIIKIQLLADLNLKKTPQLVELVDDSQDVEELLGLPPEKVLLKWMNFHLKKVGYEKQVTNFSSDLKDGEAYTYLLNALAPELSSPAALDVKDPTERANMVLEQAEKLDCKRYLTSKDIVEGSTNLNLAFVAQIFQHRNGLTTDTSKMSFAEMMTDDAQTSREERCFRLWINSLGVPTYVNNLFEDVRNGWVLLEVLDKIAPGSVNWKQANKPPIKMPFKKVENCNQVIKIGKELNFSLVNVAGNDVVQGNKKLILVEPRVVNWSLVTKGENEEDRKLNATYIISVARKLGCSIFLLPEDIIEVNQKMMLTLTASIMYWSLQQQAAESEDGEIPDDSSVSPKDGEDETAFSREVSGLSIDDSVSEAAASDKGSEQQSPKDNKE
ncbi:hypothetical protein CCACVL1_28986 [Corchorus capsularis]|uniref:Calponin-homology (CH) domain-containing protein n=1 Tax=Corchorus capsularis TaxID=210143 RepID=A0A1R3G4E9_COCAP|nr:hypothetical protein CCACVL1_28986 [Corchorus capsularis]